MLVGRDEQLGLLTDLLVRVRGGEGQVLVLEGEAGIGKSAVLEAWRAQCAGERFVVLAGRGDELGATRPFAPLLDALAQGPEGDEVRRSVHSLLGQERSSQVALLETGPGLQSLVVDDLVGRLEELCVAQPVALCLDDLHWADASTLATVASLARRAADLPLLVAVAMRRVPRNPDVTAFLSSLDRRDTPVRTTRIELSPLPPDDVAALSAAVLGADPASGLRTLLDGCAGNPLLVVELLASLRDAELLTDHDGAVDTVGDPADLQLPTTLTETVRHRVARLDDDVRAVATVAALLGSRFTLGDLASVSGRPPTELLALIEPLVDARLIVDDGTALSYRHDLVRDAVVSALPATVQRELHLQIADALRAAGAPTVRVAEQLALGAPEGSSDAVSVLRAAADEIAQQDPTGAASLLRRALELCSPTDPQQDRLWAGLVDALSWSGRINEAEATANEVMSRPVEPEAELGLRSALSRSLLLLARPHDALPHEERLIELHRAGGRSTAWPLAECAVCRVFGLDLDGALRDASEAVCQGEADDDAMAVILGLSVQSFAHNAIGDSALALELATRAAALADETPGKEGHRLHPNLFRGIALQTLGRHDDAMRAIDRGRTLGEALGAGWALPMYHFVAALAHWDSGDWDDLLTEVDAGLAHSEDRAFSIGQAFAYAVAGRVRVHRGDLVRAAQVLEDGDRLVTERGLQVGAEWLATARALLLEAQGRRPEGLDLLRLVWETASGLEASAALVLIGGDLSRLAVESGDDECATRVADELGRLGRRSPDDLVVQGRERRARGLVDRDARALLESLDTFERLGHRFEAALVGAEAAEQLLADGDVGAASIRFEASLSTFDDIGALHEADRVRARLARLSPSRRRRAPRRAVSGWDALTPTEREVVEEVCGGRSNGQVAERLGISRRTVEAHLRSIYAKLGVSTRLALAVAYSERDSTG